MNWPMSGPIESVKVPEGGQDAEGEDDGGQGDAVADHLQDAKLIQNRGLGLRF